mgnify:FL=1
MQFLYAETKGQHPTRSRKVPAEVNRRRYASITPMEFPNIPRLGFPGNSDPFVELPMRLRRTSYLTVSMAGLVLHLTSQP